MWLRGIIQPQTAQVDPEAQDRAQKHKTEGNTAFSAGKYEEAVNHFTLAMLEDPNDQVWLLCA